MNYKERAQNILDYLDMFYDKDECEVSIFQGMIYFEFQTLDDAMRTSSAIIAELNDYISEEGIDDLIITLYLSKLRLTISGF